MPSLLDDELGANLFSPRSSMICYFMHKQRPRPRIVSRRRMVNRDGLLPFEDMRGAAQLSANRDKSYSVASLRFIFIFDAAIVSVGRLDFSASALFDTVALDLCCTRDQNCLSEPFPH